MRRASCSLLLAALVACTPDTTAPVHQIEPGRLFWALTLDHHAVTLSLTPPYDTLRLTATPRTYGGAALEGAPMPHFQSTDVDRVMVDSTGLLHARKVGDNVVVVATDTVNDIVHVDTVWVSVTNVTDPPVLATLSIQLPPDSASFPLANLPGRPIFPPPLTPRVLDADGNPIDRAAVHFTSSNPAVATINSITGAIRPQQVGEVMIVASATVYGVTKADTLPYTIGLPLTALITPQPHIDAQGDTIMVFATPVIVGVGADVVWENATSIPVDVTFDDPTSAAHDELFCGFLTGTPYEDVFCRDGNVDSWTADASGDRTLGSRVRQFRVPGTYHYRSARYGTTGR